MSFATDIQQPNLTLIYLAEVTAGYWLRNFVATAGTTRTFQIATPLRIIGVKSEVINLTSRATIADVDANPGSWFWDQAAGILYVSAQHDTVFTSSLNATVQFFFGNFARDWNNLYYEPLLQSTPDLSMRIEKQFGGVGQVSGGDLGLSNTGGYFDRLTDLYWDFGSVTLKAGAQTLNHSPAYSDFVTLGKWLVTNHERTPETFTLTLQDLKSRLVKDIPLEYYPDGQTVQPIAYGVLRGIAPVKLATGGYQVAGHAIKSFDGLRANVNDIWTEIPFATQDTAHASFTVDDAYADADLSVDFTGKTDFFGAAILNGADMVADLLAYLGETALDTASFTAARTALVIGHDSDGREVLTLSPYIYVNDKSDALDVIGHLLELVRGYLYTDNLGQWHLGIWAPQPGEALTAITEADVVADTFREITDTADLRTAVVLAWDDRPQDKLSQGFPAADTPQYHAHAAQANIVENRVLEFRARGEAGDWAQNYLRTTARSSRTYELTLFWRGLQLLPGQQFQFSWFADPTFYAAGNALATPPGTIDDLGNLSAAGTTRDFGNLAPAGSVIDLNDSGATGVPGASALATAATRYGAMGVLEVLEVALDLLSGQAKIVAGNLRGWEDDPGFWTGDSDALPARFALLAGYGSGSLDWNKNWDPQIKAWARQNVGYWTDDNGFADPTDPDSFLPSAWV
jgi:hypothetical protein